MNEHKPPLMGRKPSPVMLMRPPAALERPRRSLAEGLTPPVTSSESTRALYMKNVWPVALKHCPLGAYSRLIAPVRLRAASGNTGLSQDIAVVLVTAALVPVKLPKRHRPPR